MMSVMKSLLDLFDGIGSLSRLVVVDLHIVASA